MLLLFRALVFSCNPFMFGAAAQDDVPLALVQAKYKIALPFANKIDERPKHLDVAPPRQEV